MINSTHVLHLVDNSIYIIREERGKGKGRRRAGEIEYLFFYFSTTYFYSKLLINK